ncbi:protein LONGIFOLIA 2-like [Salvia splendens]|uniref:protein LONGIFOLIA 2-like n=1 Tax=Salvia splendens TaxID=180675 RepID=UPI001101CA27|nr:protein LONGIFOLIA 2-like [Salvia splendens]
MAAQFLHSLIDEKQDLQIGCMNGIFHKFDRQHMLRNTTKRLPPRPGSSHISSSDTLQRDSKSSSQDKNHYKNMQDRGSYSIESSMASFSSSSRSSSFSSLDCNKAAQMEAGSFDRMIFPETPSSDSAMIVQPQYRRHSLDLRDLVKESIYRETHGLSMKAKPTERAAVPFVSSKTSDGGDKTSADVKESLRILTKLQEVPRYSNEPGALFRSSSLSISRDATRFSYYGDGSNSSLKLRDLPRLSLDSRKSSMRSVGVVQGKVQSRPPSVVAKLMGLDSWKEPISPRWMNSDGSVKPVLRLPIEPAPWKHNDGTRTSQKPASKSAKAPTVFPSVYSEIEKRLGDLKFMESGKDLRALKQILEAVQVKGLSETPKGLSRSVDQRKLPADKVLAVAKRKAVAAQNHESPIVVMKPAKLGEKSGISADKRKGSNNSRAKSSERESAPNSVGMRNNRTLRTTQAKEGSAGSGKISGSVGPRVQEKKLEPERRSRPPTPPNSSKSRRQPNKQQAESNSRGGRPRRPKHSSPQKSDDQLSDVSVESRNSSFCEIEDSVESNVELNSSERSPGATGFDSSSSKAESSYVPPKFSSPVSVLDNAVFAHDSRSPVKYTGKTLKFNERDSNDVERSSTVSFVSSSTDSGSAVDYMRERLLNIDNLVQKLRRVNSSHDEAQTDYIASLCENDENPDHRYISEILLASGLLLRDLGSNLTDFQFHQSGNPINPELFLVLEQTKASASSKDESFNSTTRSSLETNEKLRRRLIFDAVNETLARRLGPESKPWQSPVKLARRALNTQNLLKELCREIEELETRSPMCSLGEEDDGWKAIFGHDLLLQSDNWMRFDADVSGVVLDIERLVFKDLIDEIVRGEAAGSIAKRGSRKLPGK